MLDSDYLGRDVLSRVLCGTRMTMGLALTASVVSLPALLRRRRARCSSSAIVRPCASSRMPIPFVPGHGALPPFLAGRDAEQHELMRLLAYVEAGRGAPPGREDGEAHSGHRPAYELFGDELRLTLWAKRVPPAIG